MNAEQQKAVERLELARVRGFGPEHFADLGTVLALITELEADRKMLQRIAYLSYHHLSGNVSYPERQELGGLLTRFKLDCDRNFPKGIENPWPESDAAMKGAV